MWWVKDCAPNRVKVYADETAPTVASMDLALALTALLMGLAGAPHCAAMCGPSCVAMLRGCGAPTAIPGALEQGQASWWFHGFRLAGYALAGAVAAAGVGWLAWASQAAPVIRPLWGLLHMAALALGLWLAATGQQPDWVTALGRPRPLRSTAPGGGGAQPVTWHASRGTLGAAFAGGLWAAWPCGLLQSALVVAGLANTPLMGAVVMSAFAASSALGLQAAPAVWRWWVARGGGQAMAARIHRLAVRLAGVLLALGSAWALGQHVGGQVWAYCFG